MFLARTEGKKIMVNVWADSARCLPGRKELCSPHKYSYSSRGSPHRPKGWGELLFPSLWQEQHCI
jgi:hypothetical protein